MNLPSISDHKQEFVSQWQSSYNSLEPYLRREDAMKAELHHRVDVSELTFLYTSCNFLACSWGVLVFKVNFLSDIVVGPLWEVVGHHQ